MSTLVQQGTLNRLRGNVVYADYPELNVTAPYLAKEAISIGFEGDSAQLLGTLTGGVTSPEPYMFATVTLHLLRSQGLSDAYKSQIEVNSVMGSVNIIGDSDALSEFQLENAVLMNIQEITFDGTQAGMIVRLRGIYNVNASLYTAL